MASSSFPTSAPDVAAAFAADRAAVDAALEAAIARHAPRLGAVVGTAAAYALRGGGKRMRAVLLLAAYRAAGGAGDASGLAAAVEVVHAYSLVHDDLPCMDDDDLRRGRPTVHRAFGVPAATVTGVAMVPLAVQCVLDGARALSLPDATAARLVATLMRAGGGGGMIGGQLLDLEGEGRRLELSELERIHRAKTGALITAASLLGGMAAETSERRLAALERYGGAIGLAFQIADDVLDVTATSDQLGKTAGKDAAVAKSTYPALLGIDGASARARGLVEEALAALAEAELLTPELEWIARFSVERKA